MADPMTPERLAEIRERAKRCEVVPDHPGSMFSWQDSAKDVPALLAERDRLTEQIRRVWMAAAEMHEFNSPEGDHLEGCPGCRIEAALDGTEAAT